MGDDSRVRLMLAALDDARTFATDLIEDDHPQKRALDTARALINAAIIRIHDTTPC